MSLIKLSSLMLTGAALVAFLAVDAEAKLTESYVRVQPLPDGNKIVLMKEGATVVNLHLDSAGEIVDCTVHKRNQAMTGVIDIEKEEMTGGVGVQYLLQDLDVAWYGRQCSKWIKNREREKDRSDSEIAKWLEKKSLREKPMEGTMFCTSVNSNANPSLDRWEVTPADKCCQDLQRCPAVVAPNFYMFGLLNVFPYKMFQCECIDYFKECLADVDDEQSREISRLFFDVTEMRCFKKKKYEICEEYSTWFNECKDGFTNYVNYIEDFTL